VTLRVLVACEYSGRVRDAFRRHGHEAMSCDLLPTEVPGPHYQGPVQDVLNDGWDLMVAHPPCTDLAISGSERPDRRFHSGAMISVRINEPRPMHVTIDISPHRGLMLRLPFEHRLRRDRKSITHTAEERRVNAHIRASIYRVHRTRPAPSRRVNSPRANVQVYLSEKIGLGQSEACPSSRRSGSRNLLE